MATRLLLLSGMTPDYRIFDRLTSCLPLAQILPWIEPLAHEPIPNYARRLAQTVGSDPPPIICGVSFGGIVARELSLHLRARLCVLISSIRHPRELPPWFRLFRPFAGPGLDSLLSVVGTLATAYPPRLRTAATTRLTKLAAPTGGWHRWATNAVLGWQPSDGLQRVPTLQIHGDGDTTFPVRYVHPDVVIAGAGHELALTHAPQLAGVLTKAMAAMRSTLDA